MSKKVKRKNSKSGVITWASVSAVVLAILMALTILENGLLYPIFGSFLGGKTPIISDEYEQIYKII